MIPTNDAFRVQNKHTLNIPKCLFYCELSYWKDALFDLPEMKLRIVAFFTVIYVDIVLIIIWNETLTPSEGIKPVQDKIMSIDWIRLFIQIKCSEQLSHAVS